MPTRRIVLAAALLSPALPPSARAQTRTARIGQATAAARIQAALGPEIKPETMQSAVRGLKSGTQARGRVDLAGITNLIAFAGAAAKGVDPAEGKLWTNAYCNEASQ